MLFNHTTMTEESPKPAEDQLIIDLPNEERIQYWMKIMSCSRPDLLHAVINVGHSVKAVEAFLCMNHRKKQQQ